MSTIDRDFLRSSSSNALVDVVPPETDSTITMLSADENPTFHTGTEVRDVINDVIMTLNDDY